MSMTREKRRVLAFAKKKAQKLPNKMIIRERFRSASREADARSRTLRYHSEGKFSSTVSNWASQSNKERQSVCGCFLSVGGRKQFLVCSTSRSFKGKLHPDAKCVLSYIAQSAVVIQT